MDGTVPIPGTGVNLGGSGSLSDFATQVAQAKAAITAIEQQLTGPNAGSLTPQQLQADQNQLSALNQQLQNLQQNCPQGDTADQDEISYLQGVISVLTAAVATLEGQQSTVSVNKEQGVTFSDSSDPKLDPTSGGQINSSDQGNLFLASSFMAILWKVEVALIHQSIENLDQERLCKIHGYQNIMEMGNMQAAATYKSDMDQANIYLTQFYAALTQAFVTGACALAGAAAQGKVERENEALKDSPEYENTLKNMRDPTDPTINKSKVVPGAKDPAGFHPDKPLPKLVDSKGKEIKPGRKQIQEEMAKADSQAPTPAAGTTTVSQKTPDQQRVKNSLKDNEAEIQASSSKLMYDNRLTFWRQSAPQMLQALTQAYQAYESYYYSKDKASQDYQQLLWQTAGQVANSYLENAGQCLQAELQNIQQYIEFLVQAGQKNTQWSSIRA